MDRYDPTGLESVLEQWLITQNICRYLPVGDLLSFSRTNTTVRYLLHGFKDDSGASSPTTNHDNRSPVHIGQHQTPFWQRLKQASPYLCSCTQHTKGRTPKPCKYCSKPICEACIVKASFAKKQENTFKNRCRYLCQSCWQSDTPSRSHRYPLGQSSPATQDLPKWEDADGSTKDNCSCTLQKDGWLCLDCKAEQNAQAVETGHSKCHGRGCDHDLDEEDRERHRICLWCDKAIPRQLGGRTRYAWNQKLIDARALNAASRSADLEEYNRKRLRQLRTSRREIRGDGVVNGDIDADKPQYLRHLDTFNYRAYIGSDDSVPTGDDIYNSKRGYWRYNRSFLAQIGKRCKDVQTVPDVKHVTQDGALAYSRTNLEKQQELSRNWAKLVEESEDEDEDEDESEHESADPYISGWNHLKCHILQLLAIHEQDIESTRQIVSSVYGFDAPLKDYQKALNLWGLDQYVVSKQCEASTNQKSPDLPPSFDQRYTMSDEEVAKGLQETLDRQTAIEMQADWAAPSDTDSKASTSPTKSNRNGKGKAESYSQDMTVVRPVVSESTITLGEKGEEIIPATRPPLVSTAKPKSPVSLLSRSLQQDKAGSSSNSLKQTSPKPRKRTNSHPLAESVTTPSAFDQTFDFSPRDTRETQSTTTQDDQDDQGENHDAGELITLPDGTIVFDGPEDAFPSMDPLGPNGGDDLLRFAIANSYQRHSIDATNAHHRRSSQIQEEVRREIAAAAARTTEIVVHDEAELNTMAMKARRRSSASSFSTEEIPVADCVSVDTVEEIEDEYDDEIGITVGAVAVEVSDSDSDSEEEEEGQQYVPISPRRIEKPIVSNRPPMAKPKMTAPMSTTTVNKAISPPPTVRRPVLNHSPTRNDLPPPVSTNTAPAINMNPTTDMPPSYDAVFSTHRPRNQV